MHLLLDQTVHLLQLRDERRSIKPCAGTGSFGCFGRQHLTKGWTVTGGRLLAILKNDAVSAVKLDSCVAMLTLLTVYGFPRTWAEA